jgi:hypothetical protein
MRPAYLAVRADAGGEEQLRCDTHRSESCGCPGQGSTPGWAGFRSNFPAISETFDDPNLVSCGGFAPTMALAQRAGLADLVSSTLTLKAIGAVNAHLKVPALVAGMLTTPPQQGPIKDTSGRTGQTGGFLTPLHPRPEQNRLTAPRRLRRWIQVEAAARVRFCVTFK